MTYHIYAYSLSTNQKMLEVNLAGERRLQNDSEAKMAADGYATRQNQHAVNGARDWVGIWELAESSQS